MAAQTAKAKAETAKGGAAVSASNAATSATAAAKSASDAAASVGAINVIAPKTIAEGATAPSLSFSAGYGATCTANANYSVAIGNMAEVSDIGSIAIGSAAISSVTEAVAIGDNAKVNHHNSAAIASHSETTKEKEFSIGSADYGGGEYTREITHVSTPSADSSASTKKYTDDNDAKTLSESKKYTDANTSNALVGTVNGKLLHVEDAWSGKPLGLTIDGAYKQDGTPSPDNPVPIVVVENPVLKVTGADTSAEGASLHITLPAEHPYLAAMPNGIHDEIVIDKDGNASLVVRVGKSSEVNCVQTSTNLIHQGQDGTLNALIALQLTPAMLSGQVLDGTSTRFKNGGITKNTDTVRFGAGTEYIYLYTANEDLINANTTIDTVNAWFVENQTEFLYILATPVTYPLGKLDIPSLPETISNVWTDAELTTNMSMTYKRDINVAFENLVQAVVAAAAGE